MLFKKGSSFVLLRLIGTLPVGKVTRDFFREIVALYSLVTAISLAIEGRRGAFGVSSAALFFPGANGVIKDGEAIFLGRKGRYPKVRKSL